MSQHTPVCARCTCAKRHRPGVPCGEHQAELDARAARRQPRRTPQCAHVTDIIVLARRATNTKLSLMHVLQRVHRLHVHVVACATVLACRATSTKPIWTHKRRAVLRLNANGVDYVTGLTCGATSTKPIWTHVRRGVRPGTRLNVDSVADATVLVCGAKSTKPRWANCAVPTTHAPPARALCVTCATTLASHAPATLRGGAALVSLGTASRLTSTASRPPPMVCT